MRNNNSLLGFANLSCALLLWLFTCCSLSLVAIMIASIISAGNTNDITSATVAFLVLGILFLISAVLLTINTFYLLSRRNSW